LKRGVVETVDAKVVILFQSCKLLKEKQPKITEKSRFEAILRKKNSVSKVVTGEIFQRLPPCLIDELKQHYRVDVPPPNPDCQVQVRSGRAACVAAYPYHIPRSHAVAILHTPLGQMAIADSEVPMP